ncbi:MAG TPA: hypothetical protein VFF39_06015 [Verrucomicrobiae bacterium]|nr:hypothetical protein [Verrucomicrobiae bacterium]
MKSLLLLANLNQQRPHPTLDGAVKPVVSGAIIQHHDWPATEAGRLWDSIKSYHS